MSSFPAIMRKLTEVTVHETRRAQAAAYESVMPAPKRVKRADADEEVTVRVVTNRDEEVADGYDNEVEDQPEELRRREFVRIKDEFDEYVTPPVSQAAMRAAHHSKMELSAEAEALGSSLQGLSSVQPEDVSESRAQAALEKNVQMHSRRLRSTRAQTVASSTTLTGLPPPSVVKVLSKPGAKSVSTPLRFELQEDFDSWTEKRTAEFKAYILKTCGITLEDVKTSPGSVIINASAVLGHAELRALQDAAGQLGAQHRCSLLLVGDNNNLGIPKSKLKPTFNKIYSEDDMTRQQIAELAGKKAAVVSWDGPLDDAWGRGGEPYYCPRGWTRFGLNVGSQRKFDEMYGDWPIAYHGTKRGNVKDILATAFRAGPDQSHMRAGRKGPAIVYLTPSIVYASHERFAEWFDVDDDEQAQVVLQCRVKPGTYEKAGQTLRVHHRIDQNYRNSELEWLVTPSSNEGFARMDQLVCYGILVRKKPKP